MPHRRFLGYRAPLGTRIAEELLNLDRSPLPDLSGILLVVPGKSAIRIISEELAKHSRQGLLSPEMVTPGGFLHYGMGNHRRPGKMEELALWYDVLNSLETDRFDLIFPNGRSGPVRELAAKFQAFRQELVSNGLSVSECKEHFAGRGEQLNALEALYLDRLTEYGFEDPLKVDFEAIENTEPLTAFSRIIVAGITDLPAQVLRRLISFEARHPEIEVNVWLCAREEDADCLDDWGQPISQAWLNSMLDFGDAARYIHKVGTPAEAAKLAGFLAVPDGHYAPDRTITVIAKNELYHVFEQEYHAFHAANGGKVCVYDPSGIPASDLRICKLYGSFLEFLEENDFARAAALLRNDDVLNSFSKDQSDATLAALDRFRLNHLPDLLESVFRLKGLRPEEEALTGMFRKLADLREQFENAPSLSAFLRQFASEIYTRKTYPPVHGVTFDDEVAHLNKMLDLLDRSRFPDSLGRLEQFRLFLQEMGSARLYPERNEPAISIEGSLELPFLPQDHVIFAGLNEGYYPERVSGTPFLNDRIRKELKLKDNEARFARDIFNLHTLLASRRERGGSVHLITMKYGPGGESLRPSPLFFAGTSLPQDELLKRCAILFGDPLLPQNTQKKSQYHHFQLKPDLHFAQDENGLPIISVTDFSCCLSSPLSYYFSRILKMSKEDYEAEEMDERLFGTVCHAAFERLGGQYFATEEEYASALESNLQNFMVAQFGSRLPLFVDLQKDLLLQRLKYAAAELAKSAAEGYLPVAEEYKLGGGKGIEFAGGRIKGKIDRIEYNPQTKTLRLLDYKTGKLKSPEDAHYKIVRKTHLRFSNLQLPLYVLLILEDMEFYDLLKQKFGVTPDQVQIRCGYFSVPAHVSETRIAEWDPADLDRILPKAKEKTKRIIAHIREWTSEPNLYEDPDRTGLSDEFKELLQPNTFTAVTGVVWQGEDEE